MINILLILWRISKTPSPFDELVIYECLAQFVDPWRSGIDSTAREEHQAHWISGTTHRVRVLNKSSVELCILRHFFSPSSSFRASNKISCESITPQDPNQRGCQLSLKLDCTTVPNINLNHSQIQHQYRSYLQRTREERSRRKFPFRIIDFNIVSLTGGQTVSEHHPSSTHPHV